MIGMYSIHVQNCAKANLINNEKHTQKLLLFFCLVNRYSSTLSSLLGLSLNFPSGCHHNQKEQGIFVLSNFSKKFMSKLPCSLVNKLWLNQIFSA